MFKCGDNIQRPMWRWRVVGSFSFVNPINANNDQVRLLSLSRAGLAPAPSDIITWEHSGPWTQPNAWFISKWHLKVWPGLTSRCRCRVVNFPESSENCQSSTELFLRLLVHKVFKHYVCYKVLMLKVTGFRQFLLKRGFGWAEHTLCNFTSILNETNVSQTHTVQLNVKPCWCSHSAEQKHTTHLFTLFMFMITHSVIAKTVHCFGRLYTGEPKQRATGECGHACGSGAKLNAVWTFHNELRF